MATNEATTAPQSLSRRGIITALGSASLAAGTAVAGVPMLANASGADPIIELIEAHRIARARCDAASASRAEIEGPVIQITHAHEWDQRLAARPELADAIDRLSAALQADEAAFLRILRAVPSATAAGFLAVAEYACDLTVETDGYHAVEGTPYAYRALAALARRPVTGAEVPCDSDS